MKLDAINISARIMVVTVAKIGKILPPAGKSFAKKRK
jgi:hypothetical protein